MSDGSVDPPGLDLVSLRRYLRLAPEAPLRARLIEGGRSNLTYEMTDGERAFVLRRPPLGHVLATAHDMGREFTVQRALRDTAVPVPRMIQLCEDADVIGAPFYVMEYVDGLTYRSEDELAYIEPERAREIALRLTDVLAALHAIEPASAGLEDFGRPDGFMERQVRRWRKQFEASRTREVPGMLELSERLGAGVPKAQRVSVLHGDYRLDNARIAGSDVSAVLDWEMSALGDPLADLGMFQMYWDGWSAENPIATAPGALPGFPPGDELVSRYAAATGRDLSEVGWYRGFAFYKIAVILEGIHCRYVGGLTVGDDFDQIGPMVPDLVVRGLDALRSE